MIKRFLLTLLFLTATLFAADARLDDYPKASDWEKAAEAGDADAMYNLAHTYQMQVKDFDKAIYWYKRAYEKEPKNDIANNLGYLYDDLGQYEKAVKYYKLAAENGHALSALNLGILCRDRLHDYDKAIEWYTKAYEMGDMGGANGLGYLYGKVLNDPKQSEIWLKKAAKGGDASALKNLAHLNHEQGDNITGAAYFIAMIDVRYPKAKVVQYLTTKWNLTQDQIKQAYDLQKTLDIPKHYTGGID